MVLSAEQIEWMQHGAATVTLASRNTASRPSLGQALGCRIDPKGSITVFLVDGRNLPLLADVEQSRALAVVFTDSFSTRSLQVKSSDASEVPLAPGDEELVATYIERVVAYLAQYGSPEAFSRALLAREPGQLRALRLTPEVAFDQTPGPRAGAVLAGLGKA